MELKPSITVWKYFKADITPLLVATSLADKIAGYHVSHSAEVLLKDLKLISGSGLVNARGKRALAIHLHEAYHKSISPLVIVEPEEVDGE